jgi:hypothetical protein
MNEEDEFGGSLEANGSVVFNSSAPNVTNASSTRVSYINITWRCL